MSDVGDREPPAPADAEEIRKLARSTDPATSFEAARKVFPWIVELQATVLAWANEEPQDYHGFTDPDLCAAMRGRAPGHEDSTWRTRRKELVKRKDKGPPLIEAVGIHETSQGKRYTKWRVTPAGRLPGSP